MSVATTLQAIQLFEHLTYEELAQMGELTRQRKHPKGSVILFDVDPVDKRAARYPTHRTATMRN